MGGGKRKPGIRDISRQTPTTEEREAVLDELAQKVAPPIVVAILGQCLLEHDLETMLRHKFKRNDDASWALLTGEHGPMGTFAAKINAAYGFGILDEVLRKNFLIVKDIRNAFAHSKKLIDFTHETVVDELRGVKLPARKKSKLYKYLKGVQSIKHGGKVSYVALCLYLSHQLQIKEVARLKAIGRHYKRKARRAAAYSPFYNALASALRNPQIASTRAPLGLFGGSHPDVPTNFLPL